MSSNTLYTDINKNKQYLQIVLGNSADVVFRFFSIPSLASANSLVVYIDGLVNAKEIEDTILQPLIHQTIMTPENSSIKSSGSKNNYIQILMKIGLSTSSIESVSDWIELIDNLLTGKAILFVENCSEAIILSTPGWEARQTSEPLTEASIRGPRDGFVESVRSNTSLIRRRIRDPHLRFEEMQIGKRTKTTVCLAYIEGIADKKVLKELKTRLGRIKTDSILESGYLEEFVEDAPYSPFPLLEHTERPDKASACILEGKIIVIVDNTPFSLIVPTVMWQFIQASDDYYQNYFLAIFMRWIRLVAFVLSLSLPSAYVMLVSFHQEMLPTPLALSIQGGRENVPFPAIIEAFMLETTFEILREAGIRMPKQVGQAVSIIGGLVIGQAAVNAGLASPAMVIVVALTGICSFAIPAYNASASLRLLRFPLLFLTGLLGVFGFLTGAIAITLHVLSLRSVGAPYLSPIAPFRPKDNKDTFIRSPWWNMKNRPKNSSPQNTSRQTEKEVLYPEPDNPYSSDVKDDNE